MEPSCVRYRVNPPEPSQQFLCPVQEINSCLGTSQMAHAVNTRVMLDTRQHLRPV